MHILHPRLNPNAGFQGVEESSSKDRFLLLNSQVLLNLVPAHVAPWVVAKTGEQWHHAHHSGVSSLYCRLLHF